MLHTNFRRNRSTSSREEDFLKGFYHIWVCQPPWSCDPHAAKKKSIPPTQGGSTKNLALIGIAVSEMSEHCG